MEVSVAGSVCNTISEGVAFGGLALLYNCPRTASVIATSDSSVWGVSGASFKQILRQNALKHQEDNLKFLDATRVFDGLTKRQKACVSEATFAETFENKARVVTAGDLQTAVYFVRKGELQVFSGGHVKSTGEFVDGSEISRLGPGDCFGESQMLSKEPFDITIVSAGRSELLCVSVSELQSILGNDLGSVLERNYVMQSLKQCPVISQFSTTQLSELCSCVSVQDYGTNTEVEVSVRFVLVLEGCVQGLAKGRELKLARGGWHEDENLLDGGPPAITKLVAGQTGARLALLTKDGLDDALKRLGIASAATADQASDFTRKMLLAKNVHIFRHLSEEQTKKLVQAFTTKKFNKGANVIKQGEPGSSFFVIASGEVQVFIDGKSVRMMAKNTYFGERALLLDEPRSATVEVMTPEAELWEVEKAAFTTVVAGNMHEALMNRIRLQDTNFGLKDLKQVKVIGQGAAGVVRLVEHKRTRMRYALKRVRKENGVVPAEVQRECQLLKDIDHPFIMTQVSTFETERSVYILTELITGGELHGAIRQIPTVLSRSQGQFYAGSLVIVLEELAERNILYRDLKPENVMLDTQGYLKLIDFGIAKKLGEGENKTFTMIGTPHYMAPEVMRGHGYGPEVDLWSVGVMLFEFVCGYLPFADELDDATEVCTAVLKDPLNFPSHYKDANGKSLMKGLMTRQPRKRLGSGIGGFESIRNAEFFVQGHEGLLFDKILGRELKPPWVPKGETYTDPEELDVVLSDNDFLG
eukprot:TRINITY_DN15587_c0_g2_i1.p1 TRINITY_DN15587_c0_g2~~TRINITY_DN15587_c0_g2_i1.p1  ORF type:complete len:876 (-),score=183.29 TRINITY_DN15587_c0_g2_i1:293-2560(-)